MKQFFYLIVALLALVAFGGQNEALARGNGHVLAADVKGGTIISGLPAGFSSLSSTQEQELERVVLFADPQKNFVRIVGLADTLGWANLPKSEWAKADSAVAYRRANRVASFYRQLGFEVEVVGIETGTPFRGVRVEIAPRTTATLPVVEAQADTVAVEAVPADDTTTVAPDTVEVVREILIPAKKSSLTAWLIGGIDADPRDREIEFGLGVRLGRISVEAVGARGWYSMPNTNFGIEESGENEWRYRHEFDPLGTVIPGWAFNIRTRIALTGQGGVR